MVSDGVWKSIAAKIAQSIPEIRMEVVPELDSTNSELMRRARSGHLESTLLVALNQTAGRGRLGRHWTSQAGTSGGSLTFSLGLTLKVADWSGLSLAVGASVAQSLHPDLKLKWPNDLWWQDRKLAGVLIETAMVEAARYAVIGVGINIREPNLQGLSTAPAWLSELAPELDAPSALERIAMPLLRTLQRFEANGFAPLRDAFLARDALLGREVSLSDGTQGLAQGVDERGALLVHTSSGTRHVDSSEVSVRPLLN